MNPEAAGGFERSALAQTVTLKSIRPPQVTVTACLPPSATNPSRVRSRTPPTGNRLKGHEPRPLSLKSSVSVEGCSSAFYSTRANRMHCHHHCHRNQDDPASKTRGPPAGSALARGFQAARRRSASGPSCQCERRGRGRVGFPRDRPASPKRLSGLAPHQEPSSPSSNPSRKAANRETGDHPRAVSPALRFRELRSNLQISRGAPLPG